MALLNLQNSVTVMRKELQNLRKQVEQLKYMLKTDLQSIKRSIGGSSQENRKLLPDITTGKTAGVSHQPSLVSSLCDAAIGTVRTCFREKNGTPRQPGLVRGARGVLRVERFTNPHHCLEGLEEYSHAWVLFVFHLNEQERGKAKVQPPRCGGEKRGVFATRSPHRPCPIGLSLVKIDRIVKDTIYLSGVDLVDGTPVLDIKPYIPAYDNPADHSQETGTLRETGGKDSRCQSKASLVRVPPWIDSRGTPSIEVEISEEAERKLSLFQCQPSMANLSNYKFRPSIEVEPANKELPYILHTFSSVSDAREAIVEVLKQDPRSVYRREKCSREPYKFSIDNLNITCEFTDGKAQVMDIQPKEKRTYRRSSSNDECECGKVTQS